jgi:hypothetical protein
MKMYLPLLLQLAGVMHLGLAVAGMMMPGMVQMRAHLAPLPVFIRRLFWVYYTFIGLCIVSFSVVTIAFAETLAAGGTLARAMCAFFTVFWTLRLVAATWIFDMRPYLTSRMRRLGYSVLNLVFVYLPLVYGLAAAQPRWLN